MWTQNVSSGFFFFLFFFYLYKSFVVLKGPFFSFKMSKYLLTAMQLAGPSDIDFLSALPFFIGLLIERKAGISELASEVI